VIQVVQNTTESLTQITTSTYVDTGLSATITPTSSSNKILVFVNQTYLIETSSERVDAAMRILRGTTEIAETSSYPGIKAAGVGQVFSRAIWSMSILDSPSINTATTYKTQSKLIGGNKIDLNETVISTITLMEIAG
jgi:hypothetical protein